MTNRITFANLFLVSKLADGTARIDFMANEIKDRARKQLRETETVATIYMTVSDLKSLGETIASTFDNRRTTN
jgi:hypothetical protein